MTRLLLVRFPGIYARSWAGKDLFAIPEQACLNIELMFLIAVHTGVQNLVGIDEIRALFENPDSRCAIGIGRIKYALGGFCIGWSRLLRRHDDAGERKLPAFHIGNLNELRGAPDLA